MSTAIRQYYNKFAQRYLDGRETTATVFPRELENFSRRIAPHSRVLDVGCGPGVEAHYLATQGHRVTGVDLSDTMVALARRQAPNCTFTQGDARTLNFANGSFDAILCSYVLIHLSADEGVTALREMHRVTVPGGFLCLGVIDGNDTMEYFAHRSAAKIGLAPIPFHYWHPHTLRRTLEQLGYSELSRATVAPYPNRPTFSSILCRRRA